MPAKAGIQRSDFPGFRLSRAAARSAGMTSELNNEFLKQDTRMANPLPLADEQTVQYPVSSSHIEEANPMRVSQ